MNDMQAKLAEYSVKLEELQKKCAEAEKDAIIAETNLNNYTQQRDALIAELEAYTNCPFDEVPALLQREEAELDALMARIMQVSLNDATNSLTQLQSIIHDFDIQAATV